MMYHMIVVISTLQHQYCCSSTGLFLVVLQYLPQRPVGVQHRITLCGCGCPVAVRFAAILSSCFPALHDPSVFFCFGAVWSSVCFLSVLHRGLVLHFLTRTPFLFFVPFYSTPPATFTPRPRCPPKAILYTNSRVAYRCRATVVHSVLKLFRSRHYYYYCVVSRPISRDRGTTT